MTKEELYEACKKYAEVFVKDKVEVPSKEQLKNWSRADVLAFRSDASRATSEIELELKGIISKVTDEVYGSLMTSIGGERG